QCRGPRIGNAQPPGMRRRIPVAKAPVPPDETARLAVLRAAGLLDTPPAPELDRLTRLAARVFRVDIALVTLVDEQRQWFKSKVGLEVAETARAISFCAHCIM